MEKHLFSTCLKALTSPYLLGSREKKNVQKPALSDVPEHTDFVQVKLSSVDSVAPLLCKLLLLRLKEKQTLFS